MTSNVEPDGEYPGTDLAYDIAVASYSLSERRWDAIHQRIDVLLSFVTTLTVAAPVVTAAVLDEPDLESPLLLAAGATYLALVLVALVVRSTGSLRQLSPKRLYEDWLQLEETEFKRRMIYWAGEHADEARKQAYCKTLAATLLVGLFAIEGVLFLVWLVQGA